MRAGLVAEARQWEWSSAAVHCGLRAKGDGLAEQPWDSYWKAQAWQDYLALGEVQSEFAEIRQCTHTGRPLGSQEFIRSLEQSTQRQLSPLKGGRPRKPVADPRQGVLDL